MSSEEMPSLLQPCLKDQPPLFLGKMVFSLKEALTVRDKASENTSPALDIMGMISLTSLTHVALSWPGKVDLQ